MTTQTNNDLWGALGHGVKAEHGRTFSDENGVLVSIYKVDFLNFE